MSRKKTGRVPPPAAPGAVTAQVRAALGAPKYGPAGRPPVRRLRCPACGRTWKFSYALFAGPCPRCREGRLG